MATYGYVPEPAELGLIKAALGLQPLSSLALALAELAADGRADNGIIRLLPLLRQNPQLPPVLRLKVEQRYASSLVRFVKLEEHLRQVTRALQQHGITPLLLKGCALARQHYRSPAFRPMSDLDLAVRSERFAEAVALLRSQGFAPAPSSFVAVGPGVHALNLVHPDGAQVDLHQHILVCSRWQGADDGFWARSEPCTIRDVQAVTLSTPDHLLHACIHGYRRGRRVKTVRWIIDAAMLLRQPLDDAAWRSFVAAAADLRCEPVAGAALRYVAEELALPVHAGVIDTLLGAQRSRRDEAYFRLTGRLTDRPSLRERLAYAALDYHRYGRGERLASAAFLGWLKERWEIPSTTALLIEVLRRLRPTNVS